MRGRTTIGEAAAFGSALVLFLVAGRQNMLRDPGTFWHAVVGRRILTSGVLPTHDPFTFTRAGKPWIAQQWLAECAMALLDGVGGLDALLVAAAVLMAAVLAAGFRRLVEAGASWPLAALLTAFAAAVSAHHLHPRPHLATLALSAWVYCRLSDVDNGRSPFGRLLVLPPVLILWTNLHGGALAGVAVVLVVLMIWAVAPLLGARLRRPDGWAKGMAAGVALFSIVAPLVNPYGARLVETWWYLSSSSALPKLIDEHAPPSFRSAEGWLLTALVALVIVALFGADRRHLRITWLVPVLWAALGYTRARHAAIFAVVAPFALADLLPGSRFASWCSRRNSDLVSSPLVAGSHRPLAASLAALTLVVALFLQGAGARVPLLGAGWARLDPAYWPTVVASSLRSALRARTDDRLFNDLLFGGFLIYFVPEARIAFDDRVELHRVEGIERYRNLVRDPKLAQRWMQEQGIGLALVRGRSPLDGHLAQDPAWRRLAGDRAATLYERVSASDR